MEFARATVPALGSESIDDAHVLARYQLAAGLAAGRQALDAGCGTGYGSAILSRTGAKSVLGIDLNEEAIALARGDYDDDADFEVGDLLALELPDSKFDLVVVLDVIEEVLDADRALDEAARVLTDDGVVVVSTQSRATPRAHTARRSEEITAEELEETLRARFENVRMLGQTMHLTSVVAGREVLAGLSLDAHPAALRRVGASSRGDELSSIAIASGRPLPDVATPAVLTDGSSLRGLYEAAARWKARAHQGEADAEAARAQMQHAHWQRDHALAELEELRLRTRRG